ncbi:hypothetical protein [Paraburkholderia sp.]|jgi:hypothetical protein|uniref:hypothetical protein n=1 Tax=Paraburkholderia sp. TaxID=1926495 RepID=UPI002F40530E
MTETLMGLIIGDSALGIAMIMVINHYRRERLRKRMLRHLDQIDGWHLPRGRT